MKDGVGNACEPLGGRWKGFIVLLGSSRWNRGDLAVLEGWNEICRSCDLLGDVLPDDHGVVSPNDRCSVAEPAAMLLP